MMQKTVLKQIDELNHMTVVQLRQRWDDLLGTAPGHLGRKYMIRRLAYRIQELAYGGLSRDARRELKRVALGSAPKVVTQAQKRQKSQIAPGTRLLRDWRGERYEVTVAEDGFIYNGKRYKSLSAVAKAITGSHWGGYRFFGLINGKRTKRGDT